MTNDIVPYEEKIGALSIGDVRAQVNLIQHVMREVMHKDEHYGVIPGTGTKPSLLKAGAEKLCLTFRLDPQYETTEKAEGAHLTVVSKCTLYHIPSGQRFGSGMGSCSTKESKYAYRQSKRKCPKCGVEAIMRSKYPPKDAPKAEPGWYCHAKQGGCGRQFDANEPTITAQSIGRVPNEDLPDQYNCVTPDTRILTHDLRWVPAGDLQTGDMLIGVQEQMDDQYARHFAVGEATIYGTKEDVVYEVTFEDGRSVRCNGEHKWLVKKVGLKGTEWVATQDIYRVIADGHGRPRHWFVMSVCAPWAEDSSKEAGYVAGLLDADGSLGISQLLVLFAQQANVVLSRMEAALESRGYALGKSACKTPDDLARCESQEQVYGLRVLGGLAEQMRLLGSIRPPRLLERWLNLFDVSKRRLEGRGSGAGSPARIKGVSIIGTEEIVLIGSSCGTYIAEGLVAHNTVLKMANKRSLVAAVLNTTAASDIFTQDIEDMPQFERKPVPPEDFDQQEQDLRDLEGPQPKRAASGASPAGPDAGTSTRQDVATGGPAPVDLVTPDQVAELEHLCQDAGIAVDLAKRAWKVERIALLSPHEYDQAKAWIERNKGKRAKA